ncbi:MAG: Cys-tRNA(Pro) deacylase [Oleiphilaceae bacterium]|nr:Cys-tRNA(Pro) deacylase [Oleiphilaceae bacterium]
MTPGIKVLEKAGIRYRIHEYDHDPAGESYGLEAAEKLGVNPERVFKTLVVVVDARELVVIVLPVSHMLSMKLAARAAGGKKATMADRKEVQQRTGYVLGGVSPIGQKKCCKTIIDETARQFSTIFVSAGRRGLEIELAPDQLTGLTGGKFAEVRQR